MTSKYNLRKRKRKNEEEDGEDEEDDSGEFDKLYSSSILTKKECNVLKKVKTYFDERTPDIKKILNLDASTEEIAEILKLFFVYTKTDDERIEDKILEKIKYIENVPSSKRECKKIFEKKYLTPEYDIIDKITTLQTTDEIKSKIFHIYKESLTISENNGRDIKDKLKWMISLPYNKIAPQIKYKEANMDQYFAKVKKVLDEELYGMEDVKNEIITVVNNRLTNPSSTNAIALKGPPGVGKTSIVSAIAKALSLPFERISLGGMEDPNIFKGSDSEWVGASPSIILQIMCRMGVSNGIILLDEIDKLGFSEKGMAVQNALLHITDMSQNNMFHDCFVSEFSHDISRIWFMYSLNDENNINSVLKDRLNIIEIKPYTNTELIHIMQHYLLPRALKNVNMNKNITITKEACSYILLRSNTNGGVRVLGTKIKKIVDKLNLLRSVSFEGSKIFKLPIVSIENLVITETIVKSLLKEDIENKQPFYII